MEKAMLFKAVGIASFVSLLVFGCDDQPASTGSPSSTSARQPSQPPPPLQAPDGSVTIRPVFQPGDYVMVRSDISENTTLIGSMRQPSKTEQTQWMDIIISEPDGEGKKTLTATITRLKMTGANLSVDTDDPNSIVGMGAIFGKLVGKEVAMSVAPDGSMTQVKGLDALFDSMGDGDPMAASLMPQIKAQYQEGMLKQLFDVGQKNYPTDPVKVGDQWTASYEQQMPMIGAMQVHSDLTLKRLDESSPMTAMIDFTSKMTATGGEEIQMGAMTMAFSKVDITQTGTLTVDVAAGMTRRQTSAGTGSMDVAMNGAGQDMSMTVEIKTQSEVTLTPNR